MIQVKQSETELDSAPIDELAKLLASDTRFENPDEILKVLRDFVASKPISMEDARKAVEVTFRQYENQLRLFMVGVAKAKVPKIVNYMERLTPIEAELFKPERIKDATTAQLIKIATLAHDVLRGDLEYVGKVTSMSLEYQKVMGGGGPSPSVLEADKKMASMMQQIPQYTPAFREKIRSNLSEIMLLLEEGAKAENALIDVTPEDKSDEQKPKS